MQCTAYNLPNVRYNEHNARDCLARHYTPNTIKLDLVLNIIQKREPKEGLDRFAKQLVYRWLREDFESIEISAARQL